MDRKIDERDGKKKRNRGRKREDEEEETEEEGEKESERRTGKKERNTGIFQSFFCFLLLALMYSLISVLFFLFSISESENKFKILQLHFPPPSSSTLPFSNFSPFLLHPTFIIKRIPSIFVLNHSFIISRNRIIFIFSAAIPHVIANILLMSGGAE
jgi:hypothetical protein